MIFVKGRNIKRIQIGILKRENSLEGYIWASLAIGKKNGERKRFKGGYVPTAQEGDFFLQVWNLFMSMIVLLAGEQEKPK
ncbi:hypothetical protein WQ57_10160 [Mesobacillus campisalis]|uniref:Uncharacterized protein n=1 Tax=Mesobacillus campisalis TaxID=1408103 RepID=A0A0M2SUA9_9BACI|nr:hypothetical protein [Mesobacillus campisalis]KKK38164.1 hypothetical protein WQ57_10160 [Mesobacillus campisalis]